MTTPQAFALAIQHHQAGRLANAEALYRQILAVQPNHADALHHLGLIAQQAGHNDLAIEWIRQAILLDPKNPAAHGNLGEVYRTMGQLDEAIASFRHALEIRPDFLEAHNNLGLALTTRARLAEAVAAFRRALEIKPDYAIAYYNLGIALARQKQFGEAIPAYRRALALKPDYSEACNNLGAALAEKGELDEAIALYRRALQLKPDDADTHNNLGTALNDNGQYDEAVDVQQRALQIQPDHKCAQYNHALLLLLLGDFEHGWPLFKARWDALEYAQHSFPQPRWEGDMLEGRSLLIHAEQGLGDSIQFIRYAPLAASCGGKVIVQCQPALAELFRSVEGVGKVVAVGDALPSFDLHVPMLSQPLIFKTILENIPRKIPYLFADPARREIWRQRLGCDWSRLRVGIMWVGSRQVLRLQKRHIPPDKLLPFWRVKGVDFFSLKMDRGTEPIQQLPDASGIIDHTEHIHDFADTAALMAELDLIISVDTAVAHLAGALGWPVWTLLPFVPDWRWGLESETTPWYPTMRLFRQTALGDWDSVIQRVAEELSREARSER